MKTEVQLVILLLLNNENCNCQSDGKLQDLSLVARFVAREECYTASVAFSHNEIDLSCTQRWMQKDTIPVRAENG